MKLIKLNWNLVMYVYTGIYIYIYIGLFIYLVYLCVVIVKCDKSFPIEVLASHLGNDILNYVFYRNKYDFYNL